VTADRIVLGLVPTDRLRARDARTRLFVHALQDRLGVLVVERNVDTYEELELAMTAGRIDLAWLPPLVFARLDQRAVATAVATVVRPGDAFWSVLVTSPTSGITRLVPEQLRGRRIAWVDRLSASGHIVARLGLAALGIDPRTFASEAFAGSHIEALHAALEGRVDVAATFARCASNGGIVHGPWTEAGIAAKDVVVLGLLGEVPPDLIAASRRMSPEMRSAVEAAMMDVARDEALAPALQAIFGATKFLPGTPASYASLCQLLDRSSSTLDALASTNPPSTHRAEPR
jgi:phosphate/phosphite/phosphonate ABC transporter binding protein